MMGSLFLEIFSEEMPALMQQDAAQTLALAIKKNMQERGLNMDNAAFDTFVTPRRLGFYVQGLPQELEAQEESIRGPRLNAPSAAVEGFLRKYGLQSIEQLEQQGDFYYYNQQSASMPMPELIKEVIEGTLRRYVWPQSMRWGDNSDRWIRPIHAISCLWNTEIVPVNFAGITASNYTYGHRYLRPEKIEFNSYAEYKERLAQAYVMLKPEERRSSILNQIQKLQQQHNIALLEDEYLLQEIIGLVEFPVVHLGVIKPEFMQLPKEALITVLRKHQRYLMLVDNMGQIAPYFIIVANIAADDDGQQIIAGNQKVLEARLYDAQFFLTNDQKTPLASLVQELKKLIFHAEIGNVYTKTTQVQKMAGHIAQLWGLDEKHVERAAYLTKADLLTGMVGEFPELQGIMGYYYALHDGEHMEVAQAIRDHYKPQGPNDSVPETLIGAAVAIADKIYTLNAFFGQGIKPTGSKDPYALRRAAIGIIRILEHFKLHISPVALKIREDVLVFLRDRLDVLQKEGTISQNWQISERKFGVYS